MAVNVRPRNLGPMKCLFRLVAFSTLLRLPYQVALCQLIRPFSAKELDVAGTVCSTLLIMSSACRSRAGACGIVGVVVGQRVRSDLAGAGVHGEVELVPPPACAAALLGVHSLCPNSWRPTLSSIRWTGPSCRAAPD